MTTYTKQVYKDLPFSYTITKEGYWDKMVTKSISSNTTETVTLEPYDGVTITYNGGRIVVSSGSLPDGTDFNGFTGVTETYGYKYLYTGVGYANYSTVGSPVVDKFSGTVAGFASVSYVTSPSALPTSTYFDMIQKIKFNGGTDEQCVWFTTKDRPISFESGKLSIYQSGWHQGTTVYTAGVYWIRAIYDNGTLKLYALADNNYTLDTLPEIDSWTLEVTLESCLDAWSGQTLMLSRNNGTYWKSEMYLSGTKVSTDSEVIWVVEGEYGEILPGVMAESEGSVRTTYKAMYKPDDIALYFHNTTVSGRIWLGEITILPNLLGKYPKANFEQVGDVTYTDKVASGFNASSYLTAEIATKTSIGSYTFITKVTVATSPQTQAGVGNSENDKGYVRIFHSSTLGIWDGSANQGTFAVTAGNVYWVALHYNGENTVQYVLEDNSYTLDTLPEFTTWTSNVTVEGSFMSDIFGNKMYIGRHVNDSTSGEYWGGTIDLENTVLKGKTPYFEGPETVWWKPLGTY